MCHLMMLGDEKQTFDLICKDNEIKYSQEEKVFELVIGDKLYFSLHTKKLTKKGDLNKYYLE